MQGDRNNNPSGIVLSVKPFEILAAEKGNEIFCRSFYLDLITELSKFRQFQIISFEPRLEENDGAGLDYLIKGSFWNHKDELRINAQLINCITQHIIWSDRFEGKIDSLFSLQENLLHEIVSGLQQQLNFDLIRQIRKKQPVDLKAYESWLYGLEELKKGSAESDEKARVFFQKAIEIDPAYSLAYSGMSLTYFNEWSCQLWDRWEISQSGAFEWAEKAIELDEQNYMAAMVLGRIFMYEGAYETAEHYLRKSLRLNHNDPDSLIQIASCFTYIGHKKEAYQLYQRAIQLAPARTESLNPIGAFILCELGEYEKVIRLVAPTHSFPWVDSPVFFAAAYYHVKDYPKMDQYWQMYLDTYTQVINQGKEASQLEAISWLKKVNPFKNQSNLESFLDHISDHKDDILNTSFHKTDVSEKEQAGEFLKKGKLWKLSYNGQSFLVPEVKGFMDIQKLIAEPGKSFHCAELMGAATRENGTPLLDSKAKKEYQDRIVTIQEELAMAEDHNDFEKARLLQEEYDHLIEHLTSSLGLKGKSRQAAGTVEKARSAVTWRIRNAISRIEKVHPPLGKHLSNSIKTGTLCQYRPEKGMSWVL